MNKVAGILIHTFGYFRSPGIQTFQVCETWKVLFPKMSSSAILIFFFLGLVHGYSQDLELKNKKYEGVFVLEYSYSEFHQAFWFKRNYLLRNNMDTVKINSSYEPEKILQTCGDRNGKLRKAKTAENKNKSIVDSPYYRNWIRHKPGYHYGGEIFWKTTDSTKVYIAFQAKIYGVWVKSVCPCFYNPFAIEEQDCPYTDKLSHPFLAFSHAKKITGLNKKWLEKLSFTRFYDDHFKVRYCE